MVLATTNLSYVKGSSKRLAPNDSSIKVKQAVRRPHEEISKLARQRFEREAAMK